MSEKFIAYFNATYADYPPIDLFVCGLVFITALKLVELLLRAISECAVDSWSSIYRKIKSRKSSSTED